MKLPKVIHVTPNYPPNLGGLEKAVQSLATTQHGRGLEVSVITSNRGGDGSMLQDAFKVRRLKSFSLANTIIIPRLLFELLRLSRNDIIHVHVTQAYTPDLVWLASKVKGFRYVAHVHLDVPQKGPLGIFLETYKSLVLRRVLRAASKVIVPTNDYRALVISKYHLPSQNVAVVPNATDHRIVSQAKKLPGKKLHLLFVGRLSFQKNIPFLLQALEVYVKKYGNNFHLSIVGDGELKQSLKAEVTRFGLGDAVEFAGTLSGEKLENAYKEADLLLLSSIRESFGIVLIEAMTKGVPIVSTDIPAVRDVALNHRNGLLTPEDKVAFADAIHALATDKQLYETISADNLEDVKQYNWVAVCKRLDEIYSSTATEAKPRNLKFWQIFVPLIAVSNLAYLLKSPFGWVITLGFFLLTPGYLLLSLLKHDIKSRWEVASFSLGLSLLVIMISGLLLDSLHAFGLARPLTTPNTFAVLDLVTLILLALNKHKQVKLPKLRLRATAEQVAVSFALTLLPILAAGGAIRLNNGASDILTMILFAAIPIIFTLLVLRKNLEPLHAYAIFMFSMAVLFTTSLRGWTITGHDIQHEFLVFQTASNNNFWNFMMPKGDPYNACLSITILPTMIAKLASIPAPYVYKVVFQMAFALGILPIYFLIKKLSTPRYALIGSIAFLSFPTIFNSMPFLNRQEVAFIFLSLLLLANFHNMARRPKAALTMFSLLGLVLSHYSSGYITLGILVLSWAFFKLLTCKRSGLQLFVLPALSVPIIIASLLFTFLWNMQVTATSSNLKETVTQTVEGLWGHQSSQASGVSYSLLSPPTQNPSEVLAAYAGNKISQIQYKPLANLPVTGAGNVVSHVVNASTLNNIIRSLSAKVLQVLLLAGAVLLFFRQRKKDSMHETYFYSLVLSCIVLLVMIALLPQLSVDYSVNRLFQQTLIVTALPIVIAAEFLAGMFGRFKLLVTTLFFAFLFLDLSGFVPQALGGYPPQLSLDNAGIDYDVYYVHEGELKAAQWTAQTDYGRPVAADFYAKWRFDEYHIKGSVVDPVLENNSASYFYQDYTNIHKGLYANFLSGDVLEYTYTAPTGNDNLLYVNQDSRTYYK